MAGNQRQEAILFKSFWISWGVKDRRPYCLSPFGYGRESKTGGQLFKSFWIWWGVKDRRPYCLSHFGYGGESKTGGHIV